MGFGDEREVQRPPDKRFAYLDWEGAPWNSNNVEVEDWIETEMGEIEGQPPLSVLEAERLMSTACDLLGGTTANMNPVRLQRAVEMMAVWAMFKRDLLLLFSLKDEAVIARELPSVRPMLKSQRLMLAKACREARR